MHSFLCCSADVDNIPSLSTATIPTNSWYSSSTLLMIEGTSSKACLESNVESLGTGFLFFCCRADGSVETGAVASHVVGHVDGVKLVGQESVS